MRRVASSLSFSHRTAFHCHIGAGKLGLGLVVPAILRAGTPFAIIQVRLGLGWVGLVGRGLWGDYEEEK